MKILHELQNPWRTESQRLVYENSWIRLREDQVIRPDGKAGIYSVIETRLATGVVPLTDTDEVYLVGQYRYPTNCYSWEIPEGGAEPGESPLDAIQRELREETGITADSWQELGARIQVSNCFSSEEAQLFLARKLSLGTALPDGTERLEVRVVPLKLCLKMISEGEITDALSIIGIYRAQELLRSRS
ncbi:MAG: NUDIX hydrolase [Bdellovibrionales bacterium]|nr:NUDIX hydrolase [Bdellovibrionales bacterium]